MSVSIKPLEDRILVQTLDAEQTTASGLVIPDTAKEKPQEGKVLAVGPGRFDEDGEKRIPLDINIRIESDAGTPPALGEGPISDAYSAIAQRVATWIDSPKDTVA